MDIQKTMRRGLVATLVVSLAAIAASADIYSTPLRGGERCWRCERAVENPTVAGEILSDSKSVAYPFRTIACMLTYLRATNVPDDRIFVADHVTARFTRVQSAYFVRVPVEVLSPDHGYGVSEFDYVAFRSRAAAERFAARYETSPQDWTSIRDADPVGRFAMATVASH